jgi:hypothetical protein
LAASSIVSVRRSTSCFTGILPNSGDRPPLNSLAVSSQAIMVDSPH